MLSPSTASARAPWMSCARRRLQRQVLEERRTADVGRVRVPLKAIAGRHRQRPPALRALRTPSRTARRNDSSVTDVQHRLLHLLSRSARCPCRYTSLPSVPAPSGSRRQIEVHRPGQRIGDDQRRRRQVVGAHVLLDAALEVAVAAQHRRDDEAVLAHFGGDLVRQRSAVADAGRAAVADQIEAELDRDTACRPGLARDSR